MADADIVLDLNTIELVNGDVRITQGLEVDGAIASSGTIQIKDTNGQVRIELREGPTTTNLRNVTLTDYAQSLCAIMPPSLHR